jgi:hypothetical protein
MSSFPEVKLLSLPQVKKKVTELSGVASIKHDMCINTCIAYTGPYASLDVCPECGTSRYHDAGTRK